MNYKFIYESLITKAQSRSIDDFTESHHIVPRCMGGSNDKSNLVKLTPEEHYVAHQLLVKIYPDNHKLVNAAMMMIPNRRSNKLYGWLKRRWSSIQQENQAGDKNSQYGTKWIHNKTLQQCKKISKVETIPTGWEKGRMINWNETQKLDHCPICGKEKNILRKFCSLSCSATNTNMSKTTIFDKYLNDMIEDYKSGKSIHYCLVNRNLCGTGENHTKLKTELKNRGIV